MADIVDRLRREHWNADFDVDVLDEAADEIERLRNLLAEWETAATDAPLPAP